LLGPVDYWMWLADFLLGASCIICLLRGKGLSRHFTLALYIFSCVAVGVGRYTILGAFGYTSNAYLYFYFYSDALLTICLYFVLMSLFSHVFEDMGVSKYLRSGAMLLLSGTALISYRMVAASSDRLVTHFVIELSRNLYFVGVLLTYLLWGAMMKLRENRTRLMQLVLALGVYFSAFAASYALGNLYPNLVVWRYICYIMTMWLPLSWAYTFSKVPEEARLATSRVVAPTPTR
jgi:hypothetical protein